MSSSHTPRTGKAPRRVLVADEQDAVRLPLPLLKRLARAVMEGESLAAGDLSIAFVDRAAMRRINRQFLGHDYDTDVLSFPAGGSLAGELVISTDFAAKEARARGIPVLEEISRYVVHGILHLAGYDDHAPRDKERMWKRQEDYLRLTGAAR